MARARWNYRLMSTVSWTAMLTSQFHQDREHPAPWRARQDRNITMMLANMAAAEVMSLAW